MCLIYYTNWGDIDIFTVSFVPLAIYINHEKIFLTKKIFLIDSKMPTNLTSYRVIRQCERNSSDLSTNKSTLTWLKFQTENKFRKKNDHSKWQKHSCPSFVQQHYQKQQQNDISYSLKKTSIVH